MINLEGGLITSGVMLVTRLMKIRHLVQELFEGGRGDTRHDTISLSFFTK
jgi:hypothetical protein